MVPTRYLSRVRLESQLPRTRATRRVPSRPLSLPDLLILPLSRYRKQRSITSLLNSTTCSPRTVTSSWSTTRFRLSLRRHRRSRVHRSLRRRTSPPPLPFRLKLLSRLHPNLPMSRLRPSLLRSRLSTRMHRLRLLLPKSVVLLRQDLLQPQSRVQPTAISALGGMRCLSAKRQEYSASGKFIRLLLM